MVTVKELQVELKSLGYSTAGLKAELETRVAEARSKSARQPLSKFDPNSPLPTHPKPPAEIVTSQQSNNCQATLASFRAREDQSGADQPSCSEESPHKLAVDLVPGLPCLQLDESFGMQPLGEGGCAMIALVRTTDRAVFAAKRAAFNHQAHEQLMNEAALMCKLSHPHICRAFGYCVDSSGCTSLLVELCDGNLDDLVYNSDTFDLQSDCSDAVTQSLKNVVAAALQMSSAMAYLHRNRVLHRYMH